MNTPDDHTSVSGNLWRWSATSLRDAIRTGRVSATRAVSADLTRGAAVNESINANPIGELAGPGRIAM